MNPHCVQCGKQDIPAEEAWYMFRCKPCWKTFKALGGILRLNKISSSGGVRVANIEFRNQASFCRACGGKIDQTSQRVRHALLRGSEAHTCDDCAAARRFPSRA